MAAVVELASAVVLDATVVVAVELDTGSRVILNQSDVLYCQSSMLAGSPPVRSVRPRIL